RFSRRPSRLPHLEFARRRATCTGIIGCAASGAPLDGPQFNVKTLDGLRLLATPYCVATILLPMHDSRWLALGRVILFVIGCAVILAAASPIGSKLPGKWTELVTGTLASLGAFGLTVLFVRWEKLSLADVGAAINGRSVVRLVCGFILGVSFVALWAALSAMASPVQWVRASGGGLPAVLVSLAGYLVLACREELAFRGYPLRLLNRLFGLWFAQIFVAVVFS